MQDIKEGVKLHVGLSACHAQSLSGRPQIDMSRKVKHRLRDPVLYVTMRDHATYNSTFLTYLYNLAELEGKPSTAEEGREGRRGRREGGELGEQVRDH